MDSVAPLHKKPRPNINCDVAIHALLLDRKHHSPVASVSEKEQISTIIGRKTKACLKFFSISGCPYGEACRFLHYVVGSIAYSQLTTSVTGTWLTSSSQGITVDGQERSQLCKGFTTSKSSHFGHPERESQKSNGVELRENDLLSSFTSSLDEGLTEGYKTRLHKNVHSSEGCRFGDKFHFAHIESELTNSTSGARESMSPRFAIAASFGSISTAKISIDASLTGVVVGNAGTNAKSICRLTGARLFVRDHESDPNLRNIEMEGSLDQIQHTSAMVRDLLGHLDIAPTKPKDRRT